MWHQKQPLRFPQLQVASWVWSRGLCLHLFPNEDLGIKPNLQELSQMTRCQRRHSVLSQPKIKSVSLSWTCSTFLSLMEMEINCWIQIFFNKTFYTNQNFVEVINTRHLKLCSNSHSRSIVKVTIPMYILQAGLNLKEAWQAFVSVCKSPVLCLICFYNANYVVCN